MFRTSIVWSRIFPNGDDDILNEKGLKFYDDLFDKCLKHGIQPLVTISHYETPLNLAVKYNGWANKALTGFYERRHLYSKRTAKQTVVVFLVLCTMMGSMISGGILSRHALSFLPITGGRSFARSLHLVSAFLFGLSCSDVEFCNIKGYAYQ